MREVELHDLVLVTQKCVQDAVARTAVESVLVLRRHKHARRLALALKCDALATCNVDQGKTELQSHFQGTYFANYWYYLFRIYRTCTSNRLFIMLSNGYLIDKIFH